MLPLQAVVQCYLYRLLFNVTFTGCCSMLPLQAVVQCYLYRLLFNVTFTGCCSMLPLFNGEQIWTELVDLRFRKVQIRMME